ncbi:MAG: hypothetical protein P8Z30_16555 [Acidobacteriota bacterium]
MKTKDEPKKQTGNKAETKRAMLLKTQERPEKQSGNKPENKAGHVVENKGSRKNKPETNRKRFELLPGHFETASLPPVSHSVGSSAETPHDGLSRSKEPG